MTAAPRRYALDRDVRRSADGRLLLGGAPARLVRLSASGSEALDALLAGDLHRGARGLRERLLGHGLIHPIVDGGLSAVTFVVPVRDGGPTLPALVESLRAWGEVIVVDDRSSDGSAELAASAGARLVANRRAAGPAGARNAGLLAADTELVAFLDADCICPEDWARPIAALLDEEPQLALAAPRVRSAPGPGPLARYERARSPLDLGPHRALVGRGGRLAYLPSAALVARRSALLALGGFDEALRFGEDVDLTWRLGERGWLVRYQPELEVGHRPRPTLAAFARQRFDYGRSAAQLERRHPGGVAPLHIDRRELAVAAATAGGGAAGAVGATAAAAALAASRQPDRAAAVSVARLSLSASLTAARQLARALSRDWLPLTVAASVLCPRLRRPAGLAIVVDQALGGVEGPGPLPLGAPLRLLDNAAYAAGLWSGALEARSAAALLPRRRARPAPPGGAPRLASIKRGGRPQPPRDDR